MGGRGGVRVGGGAWGTHPDRSIAQRGGGEASGGGSYHREVQNIHYMLSSKDFNYYLVLRKQINGVILIPAASFT